MKLTLFIFGIIFGSVGIMMITGTIMARIEGTSEYALTTDMIGMTAFGTIPLIISVFFIYKALQKNKN